MILIFRFISKSTSQQLTSSFFSSVTHQSLICSVSGPRFIIECALPLTLFLFQLCSIALPHVHKPLECRKSGNVFMSLYHQVTLTRDSACSGVQQSRGPLLLAHLEHHLPQSHACNIKCIYSNKILVKKENG